MKRTIVGALAPLLAVCMQLVACTQSGNIAAPPQDAGADGDAAVVVPPTATCDGDANACLSGTMTMKGFTASYHAAKVELYRVYPSGAVKPIDSHVLAKDGRFAFSNLAAWGHYYLRGVVRIGDTITGASVTTMRGRFAVPIAAGANFDLEVTPVQLELLETVVSGKRGLSFVSAHLYDPASGKDLTDATVTFDGAASPTPMPYVTNSAGTKSYFVAFDPPVTTTQPFSIVTSHASLGATPLTWDMTPEASIFDAPSTSPKEGATIAANMPLVVTWPSTPDADYTIVELFAKAGTAFNVAYASSASIASDVTTETIPASAIPAGAYLLNVDLAQSACRLGKSQGCTYLVHPATANLTAQ